MWCQNWLHLCPPIFHAYLGRSRWCVPKLPCEDVKYIMCMVTTSWKEICTKSPVRYEYLLLFSNSESHTRFDRAIKLGSFGQFWAPGFYSFSTKTSNLCMGQHGKAMFYPLDSRNTKKPKTKTLMFYKQQSYVSQIVFKKSQNNNIIFHEKLQK